MKKDYYIYPAIFEYEKKSISISFPDLPGCISCAKDDEEALYMAKDALGLYIVCAEEDGEELPIPTKLNKINLTQNQIEALASLEFNCGNIVGFVNAYKKYGATDALCKNYWLGKSSGGYSGLPKRRRAECDLFVNGVYDMNIYD